MLSDADHAMKPLVADFTHSAGALTMSDEVSKKGTASSTPSNLEFVNSLIDIIDREITDHNLLVRRERVMDAYYTDANYREQSLKRLGNQIRQRLHPLEPAATQKTQESFDKLQQACCKMRAGLYILEQLQFDKVSPEDRYLEDPAYLQDFRNRLIKRLIKDNNFELNNN